MPLRRPRRRAAVFGSLLFFAPAVPFFLPDEGTWTEVSPLPVPLTASSAAVLNDAVYVGGGMTTPNGGPSDWFGRYDPETDTWNRLADLPDPIHHHSLVSASGKIWLVGGIRGSGVSNQVSSYSPTENDWRPEPDMPLGRGAHAAAVFEDQIYVIGGLGDDPESMLIYDPSTSGWATAPGPRRREHLTAVAVNGRLFAIGGRGYGLGVRSRVVEEYQPAVRAWVRTSDLPIPCAGCAAAATSDGQIHVAGGEGDGETWASHQVYDPRVAEWTEAAPLPSARHGIAAAAVGSSFFAMGGGPQPGVSVSATVYRWADIGRERRSSWNVVAAGVAGVGP